MATVVSVVESVLALAILIVCGIAAIWFMLKKKHIKKIM